MASNDTILITPEVLRGEAKKIRKIKGNHDTEMSNLFRLVGSLEAKWKGKSQNAYYAKFESMEGTFTKFSQMLEEFAALMEYTANDMEAKDAEQANKISRATNSFM